jgi:hypothetical protein
VSAEDANLFRNEVKLLMKLRDKPRIVKVVKKFRLPKHISMYIELPFGSELRPIGVMTTCPATTCPCDNSPVFNLSRDKLSPRQLTAVHLECKNLGNSGPNFFTSGLFLRLKLGLPVGLAGAEGPVWACKNL